MSTPTANHNSPRRHRIADAAGAFGLVVVEILALVVIFGLWVLSGWSLDQTDPHVPDPVRGYLAAYGVLAAMMAWSAERAARRHAPATAATQGVMAVVTVGLILVWATA
ncbi:DUF6234 family protein [Streptomyces sp. NPDC127098]|uniref:DUF6234 family protein n=1 Tax=Streptomyces sp. NPDC127098 TaxID=3347137 RepID=UPI003669E9DC